MEKTVKTETKVRIEIKKGSAKFIRAYDSASEIERWWTENPQAVGIAFVGRSNVGKSSLINSLFGGKTAKTSKTPGRTQKINVFTFELTKDNTYYKYYLYDLPGYGHAQVSRSMSKNWTVVMDAFFSKLNGKTILLNLQDARHPDQASDKGFYNYIDAKLVEIYLIFNKIDKLKRQKERAALNKLKPQIRKNFNFVKKIFFVSAEKKDGLEQLENDLVEYCLNLKNKDVLQEIV
jgi:GTP-binding protein